MYFPVKPIIQTNYTQQTIIILAMWSSMQNHMCVCVWNIKYMSKVHWQINWLVLSLFLRMQ